MQRSAAKDVLDPASALDWSLDVCLLPARMHNWSLRKELDTVAELVAQDPRALLQEKNLGRTTLAKTRAWLEANLGMTWEEAREAVMLEDRPKGTQRASGWDSLQHTLPQWILEESVDEVSLPAPMRNYCERTGIETLGGLVAISAKQLLTAKRVGRVSVRRSLEQISAYEDHRAERQGVWESGLLESFKAQLQELDPTPRMVVTRRCGLCSHAETLGSIGSSYCVTAERIRQHEKKFLELIRRQRSWLAYLAERTQAALPRGVVALDVLTQDAWWRAATRKPDFLEFVCLRLLGERWHVVSLHGKNYLAEVDQYRLDAVAAEIKRRAHLLPLPRPASAFRALVEDTLTEQLERPTDGLVGELSALLWPELVGLLSIAGQPPLVVAFDNNRRGRRVALEAQPEPALRATPRAHVGRGELPDEDFYVGSSLVGVKKHFPEFDRWHRALVPRVVSIMQTQAPMRQWHCVDLLEALRQDLKLPSWFGCWHLANIVRRTPALEYLGKLRVVLPGVAKNAGLIHHQELLVRILRQHGGPMPNQELLTKAREKVHMSNHHGRSALLGAPFLKLDRGVAGLLERDVPGGASAVAQAQDHMAQLLLGRGRPLKARAVEHELAQLSAAHAKWSQVLCLSVLRKDPRFDGSGHRSVRLAAWDQRARTRTTPRGSAM